MNSKCSYKKVLIGFAIGMGMVLVLSPKTRENLKRLVLEKSDELLPTIKKEIELYLDRISEAIAAGKAASQQREDELEQIILGESRKS